MDADTRKSTVEALAAAFGGAQDVSPDAQQPLHVLLTNLQIPPPWRPSPTTALVQFAGWPGARPEFWINPAVVNGSGEPPRSGNVQYVLGASWRQFSFGFTWPCDPLTPVRAAQLWLTRFREPT